MTGHCLGVASEVNTPVTGAPPLDPRLFLRDEELDRGVALVFAAERALSRAAAPALQRARLTPLEARILLALHAAPGAEVSELRDELGATTPTFARVLGGLDRRGLLTKRAARDDARRRQLFLSPEGEAALAPVAAILRDAMRAAYREAGVERVEGARALLSALAP